MADSLPTDSKTLQRLEKQRQAMQLRIAGLTLEEIAARLGYATASGAYQAIQAGLRNGVRATADELRELQSARFERLLRAVLPLALGRRLPDGSEIPPQPWAVQRAESLVAKISTLHGLNRDRAGDDDGDADGLTPDALLELVAEAAREVDAARATDASFTVHEPGSNGKNGTAQTDGS